MGCPDEEGLSKWVGEVGAQPVLTGAGEPEVGTQHSPETVA